MAGENTFEVEVLTPEGEVFNGEVAPALDPHLGGRDRDPRQPRSAARPAAADRAAPARLSDSETKRYAQAHGWLQVFGNRARLLIEEAIAPEDLDAGALKEQLADAEQRLAEAEEGSGCAGAGREDRDRAEAFLR